MTQLGAVNPWPNTVLVTSLKQLIEFKKNYGLLNPRPQVVKFNFFTITYLPSPQVES